MSRLWSFRLFAIRNTVCLSSLSTSSDYQENVGRRERTWIQTPRLLALSSFQRAVYTCIWQQTIKQYNKYLPHRLSLPESLMEHDGLSHWRWDNQHIPQSPSITPYLNTLLKKALQLCLRIAEPTRVLSRAGRGGKLSQSFSAEFECKVPAEAQSEEISCGKLCQHGNRERYNREQ